jgi:hypothetical protein
MALSLFQIDKNYAHSSSGKYEFRSRIRAISDQISAFDNGFETEIYHNTHFQHRSEPNTTV